MIAASSTDLSSISPAVLSASLIRPSIAGQSVDCGVLPSFLKTWSRRSICLLVSSRWFFRPCARSVGRLVDHLGQRLGDLLLGIVDIVQAVQQQVIHAP